MCLQAPFGVTRIVNTGQEGVTAGKVWLPELLWLLLGGVHGLFSRILTYALGSISEGRQNPSGALGEQVCPPAVLSVHGVCIPAWKMTTVWPLPCRKKLFRPDFTLPRKVQWIGRHQHCVCFSMHWKNKWIMVPVPSDDHKTLPNNE